MAPRLLVGLLALVLVAASCDSSGLGPFTGRTPVGAAVIGIMVGDSQLRVEEVLSTGEAELEVGQVIPVIDGVAARPTDGTRFYGLFLGGWTPEGSLLQNDVAGFPINYVHDIDTDLPAGDFPDESTENGRSAREVLDCLVAEHTTDSRLMGLVLSYQNEAQTLQRCAIQ